MSPLRDLLDREPVVLVLTLAGKVKHLIKAATETEQFWDCQSERLEG